MVNSWNQCTTGGTLGHSTIFDVPSVEHWAVKDRDTDEQGNFDRMCESVLL